MKRAALPVLGALALASAVMAQAPTAPTFSADSGRGAELFVSLSCVGCHAVAGRGGRTAPDLDRLADRGFTPATLAATMWNHAPAMWSAMGAANVAIPDVDEQAAADLFAYFYSTRFFEKPADAARGKALFSARGCAGCHGIKAEVLPGAPPVSRWEDLNRPFALTENMWNHMPRMMAAMSAKRMSWPSLSGQDLSDLLVYLRNLPDTREFAPGMEIAADASGAALFRSKGCEKCHSSAASLAGVIRGRTLTEIAAQMWDHAPRMAAAAASAAVFAPGEMQALLSYLWAPQFFEDAGEPARGRRVFATKRCVECHATGAAPKLPVAGRAYTAPAMVAVLWHHGPAMLDKMKARGIAWPRLDAADMSGLIAFLNSGKKEKP